MKISKQRIDHPKIKTGIDKQFTPAFPGLCCPSFPLRFQHRQVVVPTATTRRRSRRARLIARRFLRQACIPSGALLYQPFYRLKVPGPMRG